jgi:hypothetical protein
MISPKLQKLLTAYWLYTSPLRIIPIKKEIIASTIRICMSPDALYTNTPNSQPINNITAIKYNILLIKKIFINLNSLKNLAIFILKEDVKKRENNSTAFS